MSGLITFMNSTVERVLRIVLGLVLIYLGLAVVTGTAGIVIAIIGLVPIVMGAWGKCLIQFVAK